MIADETKLRNTVRTLIDVFSYMLNDLEKSEQGSIYYNMDFSVLFSYIWPNSTAPIPNFMPSGKRIFEMLSKINQVDVKFKLVFTGASFWELLDVINHQNNFYRTRRQSKKSTPDIDALADEIYKNANSFASASRMLIENGVALRQLEMLSNKGFDNQVIQPLDKVKRLFTDGKIMMGLGNTNITTTKEFEVQFKSNYDHIYKTMLKNRKDPRPKPDRNFHFKVDSANAALSIANNAFNKDKIYFATPMHLLRSTCMYDKSKHTNNSRNPLVPYYFISSLIVQKEENWFTDIHEYIEHGIEVAHKVDDILSREQDIKKMTQMQRKTLISLVEDYIIPLKNPSKVSSHSSDIIKTKEDIVNALQNAKKLKERYQSAESTFRDQATKLSEIAGDILEDELISAIDLDKDEIVQRIKKKLLRNN